MGGYLLARLLQPTILCNIARYLTAFYLNNVNIWFFGVAEEMTTTADSCTLCRNFFFPCRNGTVDTCNKCIEMFAHTGSGKRNALHKLVYQLKHRITDSGTRFVPNHKPVWIDCKDELLLRFNWFDREFQIDEYDARMVPDRQRAVVVPLAEVTKLEQSAGAGFELFDMKTIEEAVTAVWKCAHADDLKFQFYETARTNPRWYFTTFLSEDGHLYFVRSGDVAFTILDDRGANSFSAIPKAILDHFSVFCPKMGAYRISKVFYSHLQTNVGFGDYMLYIDKETDTPSVSRGTNIAVIVSQPCLSEPWPRAIQKFRSIAPLFTLFVDVVPQPTEKEKADNKDIEMPVDWFWRTAKEAIKQNQAASSSSSSSDT